MITLIVGGICLSAWITAGSAPVIYTAEAHEIEVIPPREVLIRVEIDWTESRIKEQVEYEAQRYGVSADRMWRTIKCENPALDPELQSLIVQDGVREDSWGLSQIHLPSHPHVSKEEAQDPLFAIEFMAKHFSQGGAWMWTCYRNIYM